MDIPALDRDLLLAHVLGVTRSRLLAMDAARLTAEQQTRYDELLAQRAAGVCVAYLTGHKEFRYLDLDVTPDVLVPQPDTETLVDAVLMINREPREPREQGKLTAMKVLDLCTGSGCVALSLKYERSELEVTASDISRAALDVARRNAEKYALPVTFIESDLFEGISGRYDLITANPPYIETAAIALLAPEVRNEPALALDGGPDGLATIRRIITTAPTHLTPGGTLLMEAQPEQMREISLLLKEHGFAEVQTHPDLSGAERVISARTGDDCNSARFTLYWKDNAANI
jgi:release factor glutamine methyltransferase